MLGTLPVAKTAPEAAPAVASEPASVGAGLERRQLGFIVLGANVIGWLLLRRRSKPDEFSIDDEDLGIEP